MKRILTVLVASLALFAAAGAAQAADSQPSTCQGPASQCNVFFGQ
ncbi:hypothetical protein [Caballeronia ptereochthonis]|uniref:Lipoprotein n=1 Tax=Caballeronia ptereochthonis TaxID=1777144 RepID=A0A158D8J3_9BURK|nr:hypothetical protein [Caballeronia ptereochthonis]SAK90087.1 hypothetical protein AWB83_05091 [Caballeronia ptereochthonis]